MSSVGSVIYDSGTMYYKLNDGTIRSKTDMFGTGAKVGNIKLPDFKKSTEMYSKTEPTRSDEEIKEDIVRIAIADQKKGHFHSTTKEYWDLKNEYISSVSPDRENIVTNSTKEMFTNANAIKQKPEEARKTLLELFIELEKKGDKKNQIIEMKCSAYSACFEGDKLTSAEIRSNGVLIADYSQNGWHCIGTDAEFARQQEFCKTYNEAWRSAESERNAQKNKPKYLEGGTAFDAYA